MVHTSDGAYDLAVMIGGAKAEEYSAAASGPEEAWVHADLFVEGVAYPLETEEEDPFGESFTQSWPVTPYKLRVSNNTGEKRCLVLYVDGVEAYGARFLPHSSRLLEGRQSRPGQSSSQINELLFARPRLVRRGESAAVDPKLFPELESLRLDVHEMIEGKKVKKRKRGATGGSDGQHKAACKAAGAGAMTRTGSEVVPPKEAGNRTSTTHKPGAKVATLRIRYAQKDKLQRLGLLPADAESVG